MISVRDIVEELARSHTIEAVVCRVAHSPLTDDLKDLSQMVYGIILDYDEERLNDLRDCGQLENFIARIVLNQFRSRTSPFYNIYCRFRNLCQDIGLKDWGDER